VRGGLVTLSSQGAQFLLQSISTVVLARLLAPADFGLVAMVTAVSGLGQAFADLGLSEATIQREKISRDQVNMLFWINVGIGVTLMLIMAGLSPALAWFYKEPRLRNIACVVSLTFLFGGLKVQHDALLRRQMRFKALAIRDVTAYALAVPAAIVLAWRGAGYWALVALPLTLNATLMVLSWAMARWMPGLPRRGANVGPLISFGSKVAASYVVYSVNRGADGVLIGWRWGAGPLGLYSRAYNLLMLPVRQLSAPARSVAVPAFSRTQAEPERYARYYLRAVNLILWIITPVFGLLFVGAEPLIVLALGSKWRDAAPVFQILAIAAIGQMLFETTNWLFVSRGQSKRLLAMQLILSPVIIGSFAAGLPFGIRGVAWTGSLALIALLTWVMHYAFQGTELTLRRLAEAILCPVSVSLGGALTAEAALHLVAPHGLGAQLLVAGLAFAAACGLGALAPRVRREILSFRSLAEELGFFQRGGSRAAQA